MCMCVQVAHWVICTYVASIATFDRASESELLSLPKPRICQDPIEHSAQFDKRSGDYERTDEEIVLLLRLLLILGSTYVQLSSAGSTRMFNACQMTSQCCCDTEPQKCVYVAS